MGFVQGGLAGLYFGQGDLEWGVAFLVLALFILLMWHKTTPQELDDNDPV
jgi:hypothetical protein